MLTKRPRVLVDYYERRDIPDNVWLGVSVELPLYLQRVDTLRQARTRGPKFISAEPLLADLNTDLDLSASAKSSAAARAAGTCATLRSAPGAEWRIRLSGSRWQLKAGHLGPTESTGCSICASSAGRAAAIFPIHRLRC